MSLFCPNKSNDLVEIIIITNQGVTLLSLLVKEIICDIDEEKRLNLLDIHWEGGVHTKLEVKRNRIGEHRNCTEMSIIELVRQLAKQFPDQSIAPILNRLKLKTGAGNNWTRDRIKTLRNYHQIPAYTLLC